MIERQYGGQCIVCDDCGEETADYDNDEFALMIQQAKEDGWKITQEDGEWCHYCPDCRSEH